MVAWRWPRALDGRELLVAAVAAAATGLIAFAGIHKLGTAGIIAPLALGLVLVLVSNSLVTTVFVVGLTAICEGQAFGLFTFTASLYTHATVLNALVALVVVSVGLDMLRRRRPLRLPGPLALPLVLLALAMVVGVAMGHAEGVGLSKAIHSENLLAYLLFLPIALANLDLDRRQVSLLLQGAFAVAIVKAILGLIEVASRPWRRRDQGQRFADLLRTDRQLVDHDRGAGPLRRGRGPDASTALDVARQPAADRLADSLLSALVLDSRGPRTRCWCFCWRCRRWDAA